MHINQVWAAYFSGTDTTKTIVTTIAQEIARALGVKAQSTLNSRIQKMDAFIRAHRKELEDLLN